MHGTPHARVRISTVGRAGCAEAGRIRGARRRRCPRRRGHLARPERICLDNASTPRGVIEAPSQGSGLSIGVGRQCLDTFTSLRCALLAWPSPRKAARSATQPCRHAKHSLHRHQPPDGVPAAWRRRYRVRRYAGTIIQARVNNSNSCKQFKLVQTIQTLVNNSSSRMRESPVRATSPGPKDEPLTYCCEPLIY